MTSLMAKSSLYDMVSMIIPGYLFILCVEIIFGVEVGKNFDTVTSGIVTFTISYILGLLIHLASKVCFDSNIRNNKDEIDKMKEEMGKVIKNEESIEYYYRQYYSLIKEYPNEIVPVLEAQVAFLKSLLIIIPVFLLALIVSVVRDGCGHCLSDTFPLPNCCLLPLVIVSAIILYFVIRQRQRDVYKRIFEDYHYINKNNEDDKKDR